METVIIPGPHTEDLNLTDMFKPHVALLLSLIKGNFECFRAYKKKKSLSSQFEYIKAVPCVTCARSFTCLAVDFIFTETFYIHPTIPASTFHFVQFKLFIFGKFQWLLRAKKIQFHYLTGILSFKKFEFWVSIV